MFKTPPATSSGICSMRHFPLLFCPLYHLPSRTTQISPFTSAKPDRSRFWKRSVVVDPTSARYLQPSKESGRGLEGVHNGDRSGYAEVKGDIWVVRQDT